VRKAFSGSYCVSEDELAVDERGFPKLLNNQPYYYIKEVPGRNPVVTAIIRRIDSAIQRGRSGGTVEPLFTKNRPTGSRFSKRMRIVPAEPIFPTKSFLPAEVPLDYFTQEYFNGLPKAERANYSHLPYTAFPPDRDGDWLFDHFEEWATLDNKAFKTLYEKLFGWKTIDSEEAFKKDDDDREEEEDDRKRAAYRKRLQADLEAREEKRAKKRHHEKDDELEYADDEAESRPKKKKGKTKLDGSDEEEVRDASGGDTSDGTYQDEDDDKSSSSDGEDDESNQLDRENENHRMDLRESKTRGTRGRDELRGKEREKGQRNTVGSSMEKGKGKTEDRKDKGKARAEDVLKTYEGKGKAREEAVSSMSKPLSIKRARIEQIEFSSADGGVGQTPFPESGDIDLPPQDDEMVDGTTFSEVEIDRTEKLDFPSWNTPGSEQEPRQDEVMLDGTALAQGQAKGSQHGSVGRQTVSQRKEKMALQKVMQKEKAKREGAKKSRVDRERATKEKDRREGKPMAEWEASSGKPSSGQQHSRNASEAPYQTTPQTTPQQTIPQTTPHQTTPHQTTPHPQQTTPQASHQSLESDGQTTPRQLPTPAATQNRTPRQLHPPAATQTQTSASALTSSLFTQNPISASAGNLFTRQSAANIFSNVAPPGGLFTTIGSLWAKNPTPPPTSSIFAREHNQTSTDAKVEAAKGMHGGSAVPFWERPFVKADGGSRRTTRAEAALTDGHNQTPTSVRGNEVGGWQSWMRPVMQVDGGWESTPRPPVRDLGVPFGERPIVQVDGGSQTREAVPSDDQSTPRQTARSAEVSDGYETARTQSPSTPVPIPYNGYEDTTTHWSRMPTQANARSPIIPDGYKTARQLPSTPVPYENEDMAHWNQTEAHAMASQVQYHHQMYQNPAGYKPWQGDGAGSSNTINHQFQRQAFPGSWSEHSTGNGSLSHGYNDGPVAGPSNIGNPQFQDQGSWYGHSTGGGSYYDDSTRQWRQ
jgi:hypothetical protein